MLRGTEPECNVSLKASLPTETTPRASPLTWREHRRHAAGHSFLPATREFRDFPDEYPVVGAGLELSHQLLGLGQLQVSHGDGPFQLAQFAHQVLDLFLV